MDDWYSEVAKVVVKLQRERRRKAGKHVCVKTSCGAVSRLTGRGGKILKRPVVILRLYECKLCGRDMTPFPPAEDKEDR